MLRNTIRTHNLVIRCFLSTTSNQPKKFQPDSICSKENISKCIQSLQSAPQVKLSQKTYENEAAVLIPLCIHNNRLSLLYTVRSAKLSKHVRQVSFPGGLRDSLNESWESCAIRETEEEIGIPKEQIEIWGTGRTIIPIRPPVIMPIVGFVNQFDIQSLRLNKDEVEHCFAVAIEDLCLNENKRYTQFRAGYCVPSFIGAEKRIWGITGMITHLFLNALLNKDLYSHPIKLVSKYRAKHSLAANCETLLLSEMAVTRTMPIMLNEGILYNNTLVSNVSEPINYKFFVPRSVDYITLKIFIQTICMDCTEISVYIQANGLPSIQNYMQSAIVHANQTGEVSIDFYPQQNSWHYIDVNFMNDDEYLKNVTKDNDTIHMVDFGVVITYEMDEENMVAPPTKVLIRRNFEYYELLRQTYREFFMFDYDLLPDMNGTVPAFLNLTGGTAAAFRFTVGDVYDIGGTLSFAVGFGYGWSCMLCFPTNKTKLPHCTFHLAYGNGIEYFMPFA